MVVPIRYCCGLDLGQASDFSAFAVLKRSIDPALNQYTYSCVYLHRWPLSTPYPAIVSDVARRMADPQLRPSYERPGRRYAHYQAVDIVQAPPPILALDRTGVGRAVSDMFIQSRMPCELHVCTITAGQDERAERLDGAAAARWVPKRNLVGILQVGLQTGTLKVVPTLPLAQTLQDEFLNFRVKVTDAANETFNGREGAHDDILLAVSLAQWIANKGPIEVPRLQVGPNPFAGYRGDGGKRPYRG